MYLFRNLTKFLGHFSNSVVFSAASVLNIQSVASSKNDNKSFHLCSLKIPDWNLE